MKTLENEEINGAFYKGLDKARQDIGHCSNIVNITRRLHSTLNCQPPVGFEAGLSQSPTRQKIAETQCT